MARIQTLDHCGLMVEDIPRSQKFYGQVFGAKPLFTANLNTRNLYSGWPVISFVEMGGHRFELCLAQKPLPNTDGASTYPRVGFLLSEAGMGDLLGELDRAGVAYEGPVTLPEALPLKSLVRVQDPDGNTIELTTKR